MKEMLRYNKLLASASSIGEYSNPNAPAEWAYISKYSPYQNIAKDKTNPPILFTTSTRATTAYIPAMPARWPRN